MSIETDTLRRAASAAEGLAREALTLPLDAFVRSIGVRRSAPLVFFLGAGASTSSGVPSAQMCIWEWKKRIFLTNNPGLEDQFAEISLDGIRRQIQRWLDRQEFIPCGGFPGRVRLLHQAMLSNNATTAAPSSRNSFAAPSLMLDIACWVISPRPTLPDPYGRPNFDGLAARAAANFKLSAIEVGHRHTRSAPAHSAEEGASCCVCPSTVTTATTSSRTPRGTADAGSGPAERPRC